MIINLMVIIIGRKGKFLDVSKNGKGTGNVLKLGRSGRERARTEETEAAHPAVPAMGPGEAREVLPEPVFVFDFLNFFSICSGVGGRGGSP